MFYDYQVISKPIYQFLVILKYVLLVILNSLYFLYISFIFFIKCSSF